MFPAGGCCFQKARRFSIDAFCGPRSRTYTSCFRVFRRSSMVDINPTEPGFHGVAEMLGLLDLKGGKIVEFPTVLAVRLFGVSKMKTVKTIVGTDQAFVAADSDAHVRKIR